MLSLDTKDIDRTQIKQRVINPLFRLGMTDADRTQMLQRVVNPLIRLCTADDKCSQTTCLPNFVADRMLLIH